MLFVSYAYTGKDHQLNQHYTGFGNCLIDYHLPKTDEDFEELTIKINDLSIKKTGMDAGSIEILFYREI